MSNLHSLVDILAGLFFCGLGAITIGFGLYLLFACVYILFQKWRKQRNGKLLGIYINKTVKMMNKSNIKNIDIQNGNVKNIDFWSDEE